MTTQGPVATLPPSAGTADGRGGAGRQ